MQLPISKWVDRSALFVAGIAGLVQDTNQDLREPKGSVVSACSGAPARS